MSFNIYIILVGIKNHTYEIVCIDVQYSFTTVMLNNNQYNISSISLHLLFGKIRHFFALNYSLRCDRAENYKVWPRREIKIGVVRLHINQRTKIIEPSAVREDAGQSLTRQLAEATLKFENCFPKKVKKKNQLKRKLIRFG